MASSKTAYVAFGGDASIGFASDEVLNRPSSRAFDDPPWKVFDSDVRFEPMFVEGHAPVAEADSSSLESTDTEHVEDSGPEATDDSGVTSDTLDSDDPNGPKSLIIFPKSWVFPKTRFLLGLKRR